VCDPNRRSAVRRPVGNAGHDHDPQTLPRRKRRKAAVEPALRYLNEGLAGLPGVRKGTVAKRVRDSAHPMSTAKAPVKDWRRRHPPLGDEAHAAG